MKTKEELNTLKNDVEALNKKLAELTDDELKFVAGGMSNEFANLFIGSAPLTTAPDLPATNLAK